MRPEGQQFLEIRSGFALAAARSPSRAFLELSATTQPCQKCPIGGNFRSDLEPSGEFRFKSLFRLFWCLPWRGRLLKCLKGDEMSNGVGHPKSFKETLSIAWASVWGLALRMLAGMRILLGEASRKDWFAPTTCVLLWAIVFSTGAVVGSEKYIKILKEYFDPLSFILATFTFPYTNAVFLVCISGFLGGLVSNADVSFAEHNKDLEYLSRKRGAQSYAYMSERPAIAMVRSFAVYIIYIAASSIGLAGGENGLINTSVHQYIGMAGFLSAIAFTVGYDPTIFWTALDFFRHTQGILDGTETDTKGKIGVRTPGSTSTTSTS